MIFDTQILQNDMYYDLLLKTLVDMSMYVVCKYILLNNFWTVTGMCCHEYLSIKQ